MVLCITALVIRGLLKTEKNILLVKCVGLEQATSSRKVTVKLINAELLKTNKSLFCCFPTVGKEKVVTPEASVTTLPIRAPSAVEALNRSRV